MSEIRERLLAFRAALNEWPGSAAAAQAGLVGKTIDELDRLTDERGLAEGLESSAVKGQPSD